MTRDQTISEFQSYVVQRSAHGDPRAVAILKDKHAKAMAGHLFDGEQQGLKGRELYVYARNRTVGLNPLLWLTIIQLLYSLFEMWQEWHKEPPNDTRGIA